MPTPRRQYRKPQLPDSDYFVMVDPSGVEDGPFRPDDFADMGDGVWAAQTEGHPVFLRVTKQVGDTIWSVDGAGKTWRYRLLPVEVSGAAWMQDEHEEAD